MIVISGRGIPYLLCMYHVLLYQVGSKYRFMHPVCILFEPVFTIFASRINMCPVLLYVPYYLCMLPYYSCSYPVCIGYVSVSLVCVPYYSYIYPVALLGLPVLLVYVSRITCVDISYYQCNYQVWFSYVSHTNGIGVPQYLLNVPYHLYASRITCVYPALLLTTRSTPYYLYVSRITCVSTSQYITCVCITYYLCMRPVLLCLMYGSCIAVPNVWVLYYFLRVQCELCLFKYINRQNNHGSSSSYMVILINRTQVICLVRPEPDSNPDRPLFSHYSVPLNCNQQDSMYLR